MRSPLLPAAVSSLAVLLGFSVASPLSAAPVLVMDATSGAVLYQQDATQPWYPASLTKLMTVYVALKAVHEGRLTLDTPLVVSPYANSMSPSKMGFRPGTEVTLDNALKMLMVKSANDLAVTIAEGVSGSVEAFADEMNAAAASIGMRESRFFNPNGLPDPRQVTSARDMALLGRALYLQFPEHADLFNIFAFRLGSRMSRNHNPLLGFYPGVDGMKTGFTCSAGFNIVATALRGDRRLITVVMGAPSSGARTAMATALFDRGFASTGSMGPVTSLGGTPLPVTAYAPEAKPAVLDGSAAPIAASAADASPLRRTAEPAGKPAKTVASREDDDSAADAGPKAKTAKHAKAAHHRHSK